MSVSASKRLVGVTAAFFIQAVDLRPAMAEAPQAPEKPWTAEVGVGVLVTSGNTENRNLNLNANGAYEGERWRESARIEVTRNRSAGVDTAERYFATEKTAYKLDAEGNYIFLDLSYENDRFSGYDYQATEALGYGRSVLKGPAVKLDLETGVGSRQTQPIDSDDQQSDEFVRLAAVLDWKVSEQATFREELSSDIGQDLTVTTSLTSLTTQVVGNLAAKVAVRVRNISDVPPGIYKTDTETTINLVYKF